MKLEYVNRELNALCEHVGAYISSEQHKLSNSDINTKGLHDYVTHVDQQSEAMLVKELSNILPDSGFLVEEKTIENDRREYTWIIDPLDGTTNYIHGLPVFAISVALMKEQEVIMGTVYDAKSKECFYAWQDSPAFMNNNEIRVSAVAKLEDSLLATGFPYSDFNRQQEYLKVLGQLMQKCRGIRRFGAAAIDLAWVACGRFDGFYEYNLHAWDVAAGSFIVERAGGLNSDFKGGKNFLFGREIVSGNPAVFGELLSVVQKHFE
jgi:myo-inositol-1(or 4)-monophosphatase